MSFKVSLSLSLSGLERRPFSVPGAPPSAGRAARGGGLGPGGALQLPAGHQAAGRQRPQGGPRAAHGAGRRQGERTPFSPRRLIALPSNGVLTCVPLSGRRGARHRRDGQTERVGVGELHSPHGGRPGIRLLPFLSEWRKPEVSSSSSVSHCRPPRATCCSAPVASTCRRWRSGARLPSATSSTW